ncbi:KilA-N domain-containing protein, partial [Vibrio parahaemolyticus]|nr:KilA-N domain-containing protein [Vibrio parahaemolyticus]
MPNQIVISNHAIPLDHEKRVNLNALHHLSAANENKRPSQWLRLKSTQELIDALYNSQSAYLHSALKVINGGD